MAEKLSGKYRCYACSRTFWSNGERDRHEFDYHTVPKDRRPPKFKDYMPGDRVVLMHDYGDVHGADTGCLWNDYGTVVSVDSLYVVYMPDHHVGLKEGGSCSQGCSLVPSRGSARPYGEGGFLPEQYRFMTKQEKEDHPKPEFDSRMWDSVAILDELYSKSVSDAMFRKLLGLWLEDEWWPGVTFDDSK
jgi:hypothetical protein